jgi:hypothetical protein
MELKFKVAVSSNLHKICVKLRGGIEISGPMPLTILLEAKYCTYSDSKKA